MKLNVAPNDADEISTFSLENGIVTEATPAHTANDRIHTDTACAIDITRIISLFKTGLISQRLADLSYRE